MSLPPWQDPGNPGNPNSVFWQQQHGSGDVNKRKPTSAFDLLWTGAVMGIVGLVIIWSLFN